MLACVARAPFVFAFAARLKGGFVGLGGCSHPYASDLADGIYIEQGEANPPIAPNSLCALDAGVFRCRRATPAAPPRQKGSFLAESPCGGRERSIAPPSDQKTRFAGFAVRTRRCGATGRKPGQRVPVRYGGNAEGANLGAYPVCRFAVRLNEKRPGTKTQCRRGFAVDLPRELQQSAYKRFAHRLTHRTLPQARTARSITESLDARSARRDQEPAGVDREAGEPDDRPARGPA